MAAVRGTARSGPRDWPGAGAPGRPAPSRCMCSCMRAWNDMPGVGGRGGELESSELPRRGAAPGRRETAPAAGAAASARSVQQLAPNGARGQSCAANRCRQSRARQRRCCWAAPPRPRTRRALRPGSRAAGGQPAALEHREPCLGPTWTPVRRDMSRLAARVRCNCRPFAWTRRPGAQAAAAASGPGCSRVQHPARSPGSATTPRALEGCSRRAAGGVKGKRRVTLPHALAAGPAASSERVSIREPHSSVDVFAPHAQRLRRRRVSGSLCGLATSRIVSRPLCGLPASWSR